MNHSRLYLYAELWASAMAAYIVTSSAATDVEHNAVLQWR